MAGIGIHIPNVDWSSNNVGKVTVKNEKPLVDAQALYDAYIAKSGRQATPVLLNFLKELVDFGLTPNDTYMYYLASNDNNTNRIIYNVFDTNIKLIPNLTLLVNSQGTQGVKNEYNYWGSLTDRKYTVNKGFFWALIVSNPAAGQNYTIAAQTNKDDLWYFNTSGSYSEVRGISCRNKSGSTHITKTDDPSPTVGAFVCGANAIGPHVYKHNDLPLISAPYSFVPPATTTPSLLGAANDIMKLYMPINRELSNDQVVALTAILNKYVELL